jgi:hypothetical protein
LSRISDGIEKLTDEREENIKLKKHEIIKRSLLIFSKS